MESELFRQVDWDAYARDYDALRQIAPYIELQRFIASFLMVEDYVDILNAGCGTGNLELSIVESDRELRCRMFSVDFSPQMLKLARSKIGPGCMIFAEADLGRTLPFERGTFSQVVSVNSLYAMESPEFFLSEARRLLAPAGQLLLVNPKKGYQNGLIMKAHCRDDGPDGPWLDVHISEEKEREVIYRSVSDSELRQSLLSVARINRRIATSKKMHFFSRTELADLLKSQGFDILEEAEVYADQGLFFLAEKRRMDDD